MRVSRADFGVAARLRFVKGGHRDYIVFHFFAERKASVNKSFMPALPRPPHATPRSDQSPYSTGGRLTGSLRLQPLGHVQLDLAIPRFKILNRGR